MTSERFAADPSLPGFLPARFLPDRFLPDCFLLGRLY
jgi:hypothetical protein